jgi:hypothetical protein
MLSQCQVDAGHCGMCVCEREREREREEEEENKGIEQWKQKTRN